MTDKPGQFVCVRPLRRSVELWYTVPASLSKVAIGSFVRVPLRNRAEIAEVIQVQHEQPILDFPLRAIETLFDDQMYERYHRFLDILSWYYQVSRTLFIAKLRMLFERNEQISLFTPNYTEIQRVMISLTDEQQKVVSDVIPDIKEQKNTVFVIHGVTGSGKTECYKAMMHEAVILGKSVLFLLPEVALAQAFEYRLKKEMPELPLCAFHSSSSKKEKDAVYSAIHEKRAIVIIGVHLPVMLPVHNLGLIIIDEEHDSGYQEKNHPKLNTKEIAIFRAKIDNIPLVLGSATPSVSTLYNVETKSWRLHTLTKRFAGKFPAIEQISLLEQEKRSSFWISKRLEKEIRKRLEKKEQILLFLNRRGMHFFVQCTACSFVFTCSACAVSLTLHEDDMLVCHYCSRSIKLSACCPECKKSEFLKKGIGTQQLVTVVQKLFPEAKIVRFDGDSRKKKGFTADLLEKMKQGEVDILIGTQAIARGLHFERVSLVGIIWADLHFHLPLFNAVEQSMQQLIQIAGRAGRSNQVSESLVLVQTISQNQSISHMSEHTYLSLYAQEIEQRKLFSYPPFIRLSEIELRNHDEEVLVREATDIASWILALIREKNMKVTLLGPAKPLISKIEHVHSRKLYLKSERIQDAIAIFRHIALKSYVSKRFFVPSVTML